MKTNQFSRKSYLYIALSFFICLTMVLPVNLTPQVAKAQLSEGDGLPDGTYFRLLSDVNKVFKIESGSKRQLPFPSNEILDCLEVDPSLVVDGTSAEESLPVGSGLFCNPKDGIEPQEGSLISDLPDSDVTSIYLVENGTRRPFPSNEVFDCLGYSYSNVHIANTLAVDLPIGEGMTCSGPSFDLSCGVNQTVTRGQDAYYPISATNLSSIDKDISTTMSTDIIGPEMVNSPLTLNSGNNWLDYADIPTGSLAVDQTYILTFTSTANGVTKECNSNLTIQGITPIVDIKFNGSDGPTTPNPSNGSTGQISWTTTDAVNCTASGAKDWDGDRAVSNGNEQAADINNLEVDTTYTLLLTCTSVDGISSFDSVEVFVGDPKPPTANFYCEGDILDQKGEGYCTTSSGSNALLFYSTTYVTSCSLSPEIPDYKPGTNENDGVSTGTLINPPASVTYTLICTGEGGSIEKSARIDTINDAERSVDLKCTSTNGSASDGPCYVEPKAKTTLSWAYNSCGSISIDQGIGVIDYNNIRDGLEVTVNETTTYTISCTPLIGNGEIITDSVLVSTDPSQGRSVDLKCTSTNGQASDGPCTVQTGTSTTLSWTSNNCGDMSIDPGIGDITTTKQSTIDTVVNETTTFIISCAPIVGDGMTISDSVVVNVTDSVASANCAPSPLNITKGGAPGVITVDVSITNYKDSQINVAAVFDDYAPVQYPTFSYENNPLSKPGVASVILSTDKATQTGTFSLKIVASGDTFVGALCFVTVIVSGDKPNPPENVQANTDGDCGTVTVTWQRPTTGQIPDSYQVYRYNYPHGAKAQAKYLPVGPLINDSGLSDGNFTYTDTEPLNPDDINTYAVSSFSGAEESTLAESNNVIPISCSANLNQSDKDLVKVGNFSSSPLSCNNTSDPLTLPSQGVFKAGSKVYFKVNVCNSGSKPLTGLIVRETGYSNLNDLKLEEFVKDFNGQQNCVQTDSGDGTFYLNDIQPRSNKSDPIPVCTLQISATLTAPEKSSGYLYRFWNQAIITSNELDAKVVSTPPYLFSNGGNDVVPTRGEAAQ